MRRLYYCTMSGVTVCRVETLADDFLLPTAVGTKRVDALQASTKAFTTVPSASDLNGNVIYTARHGGSKGNDIFIEHSVGNTGEGFEGRNLEVLFDPNDEDGPAVRVVFGTTGDGDTIVPTAQQVVDLISAKTALAHVVTAAFGGTGAGNAGLLDPTYLGGGVDNGDWRKFNVYGGRCLRINTIEVI